MTILNDHIANNATKGNQKFRIRYKVFVLLKKMNDLWWETQSLKSE